MNYAHPARLCIVDFLPTGMGNIMFRYAYALGLRAQGIPTFLMKFRPYSSRNTVWQNKARKGRARTLEAFPQLDKIELPSFVNSALWATKKVSFLNLNWEDESFDVAQTTKPLVFVSGYFMSEDYFAHAQESVRKAFSFDESNPALSEAIQVLEDDDYSVAIHMRCGDYFSSECVHTYENIATREYYHTAMDYINNRRGRVNTYVFSDDMEWVAKNYGLENPLLEKLRKLPDYQDWWDMCLMSHAHHNIIANSSFSWWGAWLNAHEDKIVVCPERWDNLGQERSATDKIQAAGFTVVDTQGKVWNTAG